MTTTVVDTFWIVVCVALAVLCLWKGLQYFALLRRVDDGRDLVIGQDVYRDARIQALANWQRPAAKGTDWHPRRCTGVPRCGCPACRAKRLQVVERTEVGRG